MERAGVDGDECLGEARGWACRLCGGRGWGGRVWCRGGGGFLARGEGYACGTREGDRGFGVLVCAPAAEVGVAGAVAVAELQGPEGLDLRLSQGASSRDEAALQLSGQQLRGRCRLGREVRETVVERALVAARGARGELAAVGLKTFWAAGGSRGEEEEGGQGGKER